MSRIYPINGIKFIGKKIIKQLSDRSFINFKSKSGFYPITPDGKFGWKMSS
jgi:hypothetical protein